MTERPDRYPVLSPALAVPSVKELIRKFEAFAIRMRRNLGDDCSLPYEQETPAHGRIPGLAHRAHARRLREAGLHRLKEDTQKEVIALARDGGRISGPMTEHAVDEWAAAAHRRAPWMADLTTLMMRHMRMRVRAGHAGFSCPPLLIVGPPGNGKSMFARLAADLADVAVREIDVGAGSAGFRIAGVEKGWSSASLGLPVEEVLDKGAANPMLIVNEVDKIGRVSSNSGSVSNMTTALLQVLEPETARRFECPVLRVVFDLSRISWVLTANDLDRIPAPLRDRCTLFRMPDVDPNVARLMFDTLACDCPDIDPVLLSQARSAVITAAARGHVSLRQIKRILDRLSHDTPMLLH